MNPLTAVSLNLSQVKEGGGKEEIKAAQEYTKKALAATKKMEQFMEAVKKQLRNEENARLFSLNREIRQAMEIFDYKAKKAGVNLRFIAEKEVKTFGDAVKFNQIISNLISNAIDACESSATQKKEVRIDLKSREVGILLLVNDNGCGIKQENINKIFEPFFTTKKSMGLGIGLSSIKGIIEKNFGGTIGVRSHESEGSEFLVSFPLRSGQ